MFKFNKGLFGKGLPIVNSLSNRLRYGKYAFMQGSHGTSMRTEVSERVMNMRGHQISCTSKVATKSGWQHPYPIEYFVFGNSAKVPPSLRLKEFPHV